MAGDAIRIDVRGVETLNASLDRLERDLADIAPPDAAVIIGRAAQANAPKRTGRLAGSFSSTAESGALSVTFGVRYAGPINFGVGPRTGLRGPHNIRATRFLSDAITDQTNVWIESYKRDAQVACDQVKGA